MILITILKPILQILGRLILGISEDIIVAKNNYYEGSKLQSATEQSWNKTKVHRRHVKCITKGFFKGLR